MARKRVELFDARLDVVLGDALTLGDGGEIYVSNVRFVIDNHRFGNIQTRSRLGAHRRDP